MLIFYKIHDERIICLAPLVVYSRHDSGVTIDNGKPMFIPDSDGHSLWDKLEELVDASERFALPSLVLADPEQVTRRPGWLEWLRDKGFIA